MTYRQMVIGGLLVASVLAFMFRRPLSCFAVRYCPCRLSVVMFLKAHGFEGCGYCFCHYSGDVPYPDRLVVEIISNPRKVPLDCLGQIPYLGTIFSGNQEVVDIACLTNCSVLNILKIPLSTVKNEELLLKMGMSNVWYSTTNVYKSVEMKNALKYWYVSVRATKENFDDILSIDNAEDYYSLIPSDEFLASLSDRELEDLKRVKFRYVGGWRADYFWDRYDKWINQKKSGKEHEKN